MKLCLFFERFPSPPLPLPASPPPFFCPIILYFFLFSKVTLDWKFFIKGDVLPEKFLGKCFSRANWISQKLKGVFWLEAFYFQNIIDVKSCAFFSSSAYSYTLFSFIQQPLYFYFTFRHPHTFFLMHFNLIFLLHSFLIPVYQKIAFDIHIRLPMFWVSIYTIRTKDCFNTKSKIIRSVKGSHFALSFTSKDQRKSQKDSLRSSSFHVIQKL